MATHPLWRPFDLADLAEFDRVRVGAPVERPVVVVPPDPDWPTEYARVRRLIVDALWPRALEVEHVGSTSVPDLWAKPVIDVDLGVADSSREAEYVPALQAAGFVLTVREPDWEEHRLLTLTEPASNVHVFSVGAVEAARQRAFRDWLRGHADDREAYGALKRELAERNWPQVMAYNNAKAALIYDIYERIFAADPKHPHDPEPRTGR